MEERPLKSNLKKLMAHYGLNGARLARAAGVSYPNLHNIIEGDTTDPRVSSILPVAKQFNISIQALFEEDAEAHIQEMSAPKMRIPKILISEIPTDVSSQDYKTQLLNACHTTMEFPFTHLEILCAVDVQSYLGGFPDPFSSALMFYLARPEQLPNLKPILFYHTGSKAFTLRKVMPDGDKYLLQSFIPGSQPTVYNTEDWLYIGVIVSATMAY